MMKIIMPVPVSAFYPVRKPRHSCLSADRYGGDNMDKISPYRKDGVKAPSFLTGRTSKGIIERLTSSTFSREFTSDTIFSISSWGSK
jgi:hypothetical protein